MKNSIKISVMIVSLFGFAGSASAGSGQKGTNKVSSSNKQMSVKVAKVNKNIQSQVKKGQGSVTKQITKPNQALKTNSMIKIAPGFAKDKLNNPLHNLRPLINIAPGAFTNHKHKHDDKPTLRPLSGDGRVPTAEPTHEMTLITQPKGPSGYVWNNGHWERPKANGTSVSTAGMPSNASVVIRDHAAMVKPTTGGVSNGKPEFSAKPPAIGNNGTVSVTNTPLRELTGQTVYGSGIGIKELMHVANPQTFIDALPPWGFEAAPYVDRDHRETKHGHGHNNR